MTPTRSARRRAGQATIVDVARLANCSRSTVSRVINAYSGIPDSTREAVLAAIAELRYTPNSAARNLAGGAQPRIALLYGNPSSSYLSELLMGALEQASIGDLPLVVEACGPELDKFQLISRVAQSGIDGALLGSPFCDEDAVLDHLHATGLHAVLVGPATFDPRFSTVMIDDYKAAFDMTRYIIELGHRNVGFIVGSPYHVASGKRLLGFRDAMHQAGLWAPEECIQHGDFTYKSGFDSAARLLRLANPPTAIFASNDDMAAGVIAAAHRAQFDVPRDVSVFGFDDTAIASTIQPGLTTIHQPIRNMARRALEVMANELHLQRAGAPQPPRLITFDHAIVRRESEGPTRTVGAGG